MMLEILGTRIIAPYFGSSIYVWSSLITVTLLALAVGYWVGGYIADKKPDIWFLLQIVLLAGIFIAAIPFLKSLIIPGRFTLDFRIGTLLGSIILFFPPLLLLGMVIPYVLKLQITEFRKLGLTAGKIYAVSTIGGIFGTLLCGFYLVPNISLRWILSSLSVGLIFFSGIGLLLNRRVFSFLLSVIVSFGILILTYLTPENVLSFSEVLIYQADSLYGHVEVIDRNGLRMLTVDGIPQTMIEKSVLKDMKKGYFLRHNNFVELLPFYHPGGVNALLIGLGGGLDAHLLKLYNVHCDAVEINPKIVDIARNYFCYDGTVAVLDGRQFVTACGKEYDFIILDVFAGDDLPFHLLTQEMFTCVKNILTPGGIFLVNYIGYIEGQHSSLTWALFGTIHSVFEKIHIYPVEMVGGLYNIRFFASDAGLKLDEGKLMEALPDFRYVDIYELKQSRIDNPQEIPTVITDDRNPSELWWAETSMALRMLSMDFLRN